MTEHFFDSSAFAKLFVAAEAEGLLVINPEVI
jgi:hypothetical protein